MISSHHFAARSAEPFVFTQDTLRRTVGKLGYLQATAPVFNSRGWSGRYYTWGWVHLSTILGWKM